MLSVPYCGIMYTLWAGDAQLMYLVVLVAVIYRIFSVYEFIEKTPLS